MYTVTKESYRDWPNSYRLSNGTIDLVVTTDVGPRIIRLGFVGEENEFVEMDDQIGRTSDTEWINYGGHRLWHAPEERPRTYYPDSRPLSLEEHDGFVRTVQDVESTTGIQKEMDIHLHPEKAAVTVVHRLHNRGLWSVDLAPWALSVMAPGGVAVLPLPARGTHAEHLTPGNRLVLWKYTDMADPRWTWGRQFILLRQDTAGSPQKVGLSHADWVAYARKGHLFVKRFPVFPDADYADMGCSVEAFTNARMLEVETLAPLAPLAPGASVEHVEHWSLFQDVPMPGNDADVERDVLPKVGG